VRTFSKAFGLAGLRVGYAVGAPRVIGWLRAVGSPFTCGTASRRAAQLRLRTGGPEVAAFVARVAREREELSESLRTLGLEPLPSAGNFVYVRGVDPTWLCDALRGLGIAVRGFADGVRITMPAEENAFARLQKAIAAAVAPEALLLDLDGVLADVEGRAAIADPPVLASLAQRLPIGVVTGCPRRLAESVLERHGFRAHVRALIASEDGPGKPDPAPVRQALQKLSATSAWLLGDNPGDVQAARGAGVVPLAIAPHGSGAAEHAFSLREVGVARLVASLADLGTLLNALPAR
jgi:phosphoglycolate phosphatase-like HAD superfamily hydrolase